MALELNNSDNINQIWQYLRLKGDISQSNKKKKLWYLFIQSEVIVSRKWVKKRVNKEEIRYILKFYYKKEKNATQAAKKNLWCYGHDAVSIHVA